MATRPAKAPFRIIVRSALPQVVLHTSSAAIAPAAAAAFVLRKIWPTAVAFSKSDTIS